MSFWDTTDLINQVDAWTSALGITNSLKTGIQDKNAFAHAYSSAQLVYDGGEVYSRFLGTNRELRSYVTDSWEALTGNPKYTFKGVFLDGNRDEYNNQVGIEIAEYALANGLPRPAIGYLIADALNNGELISDEFRDSRNSLFGFFSPGISVTISVTFHLFSVLSPLPAHPSPSPRIGEG